jgi:hypothetical protein
MAESNSRVPLAAAPALLLLPPLLLVLVGTCGCFQPTCQSVGVGVAALQVECLQVIDLGRAQQAVWHRGGRSVSHWVTGQQSAVQQAASCQELRVVQPGLLPTQLPERGVR